MYVVLRSLDQMFRLMLVIGGALERFAAGPFFARHQSFMAVDG